MDSTKKNIGSIHGVVKQLEELFDTFNNHLFNGELQKPVITVSPDVTRGAYGWCTSWKAWKQNDEDDGRYEINLCAEHLNRPFQETCCTLVHEMIHLLNLQNEVQDTSRSGLYHNKKFKEAAEAHGLVVEKDAKYGYCYTTLTTELEEFVETLNGEPFELYRTKAKKLSKNKGSSSRKYVCPICGTIVRATKEVRIICSDCGVEFLEDE